MPAAVIGSITIIAVRIQLKGDTPTQSIHLQHKPQTNYPGFVLLMMPLLVIVLGVLVYFFGIYPEDRETKRIQKQSPDKYPWVEEWRIEHPGLRKPRDHEERELCDAGGGKIKNLGWFCLVDN